MKLVRVALSIIMLGFVYSCQKQDVSPEVIGVYKYAYSTGGIAGDGSDELPDNMPDEIKVTSFQIIEKKKGIVKKISSYSAFEECNSLENTLWRLVENNSSTSNYHNTNLVLNGELVSQASDCNDCFSYVYIK